MYSNIPHRNNEYKAIESLAERALKGELGDIGKALETLNGVAFTLKLRKELVDGIVAAVRDSLKNITD